MSFQELADEAFPDLLTKQAVGAMPGVITCLIQCANYYSGKCCPSEEWMAARCRCFTPCTG